MKTIKRFIYLLFQWGRYLTPYTQITFTYSKLTKETLEKRCEICSKLTIKETLAQVFSCEFCKISKNAFFTEHLWAAASEKKVSACETYVWWCCNRSSSIYQMLIKNFFQEMIDGIEIVIFFFTYHFGVETNFVYEKICSEMSMILKNILG